MADRQFDKEALLRIIGLDNPQIYAEVANVEIHGNQVLNKLGPTGLMVEAE